MDSFRVSVNQFFAVSEDVQQKFKERDERLLRVLQTHVLPKPQPKAQKPRTVGRIENQIAKYRAALKKLRLLEKRYGYGDDVIEEEFGGDGFHQMNRNNYNIEDEYDNVSIADMSPHPPHMDPNGDGFMRADIEEILGEGVSTPSVARSIGESIPVNDEDVRFQDGGVVEDDIRSDVGTEDGGRGGIADDIDVVEDLLEATGGYEGGRWGQVDEEDFGTVNAADDDEEKDFVTRGRRNSVHDVEDGYGAGIASLQQSVAWSVGTESPARNRDHNKQRSGRNNNNTIASMTASIESASPQGQGNGRTPQNLLSVEDIIESDIEEAFEASPFDEENLLFPNSESVMMSPAVMSPLKSGGPRETTNVPNYQQDDVIPSSVESSVHSTSGHAPEAWPSNTQPMERGYLPPATDVPSSEEGEDNLVDDDKRVLNTARTEESEEESRDSSFTTSSTPSTSDDEDDAEFMEGSEPTWATRTSQYWRAMDDRRGWWRGKIAGDISSNDASYSEDTRWSENNVTNSYNHYSRNLNSGVTIPCDIASRMWKKSQIDFITGAFTAMIR
eukprot:PhF_6_TR24759/c0_g1_i1/m.33951